MNNFVKKRKEKKRKKNVKFSKREYCKERREKDLSMLRWKRNIHNSKNKMKDKKALVMISVFTPEISCGLC